ncbi:MAG TPA: ABC transporter substrate-binding protein [Trebonia sp.]
MKQLTRIVVSAASATIAAAALAACGSSGGAVGSSAGDQTVTFAGDGYTLAAEAYIGQAKGFFAQEKLTPKVVTFATGVDGINAMIANQVQFSFGLDFAAVSTATKYVAVLGSVGSPSSAGGYNQMFFSQGITAPGQLAGKKIGVLNGTDQEYLTDKWIAKYGLTGKVQTVNLPGLFELVGALESGQINAAFLYADGTTAAEKDKSLFHFGDDSGLVKVQGIYVLALRKTVNSDPALVLRVLRALKATDAYMAANPAAAGAILATAEPGSGSDAQQLGSQIKLDAPGLGMTQAQYAALLQIQGFLKSSHALSGNVNIATSLDEGPLNQVAGTAK